MNDIPMHDMKCLIEFNDSYEALIQKGTEYAKTKNIAIVTLARNSSENIGNNLNFLSEQIEPKFNSCHYYIYENDSSDNTPEIIRNWAKTKDNVVFVTEKLDTPYMPLSTSTTRTENLAKARNKYVDYIESIKDKLDYVIVLDSDFRAFSIKGLFNSFGWLSEKPEASAIAGFSFLQKITNFPNGTESKHPLLTNYDSWAYRHTWWSDTQQNGLMYWFQWWIPLIGSPLIKVNSAFGGCCIYNVKDFCSARYSGENCEHVLFNQKITYTNPNFNLYVNPSQIMYV